MEKAGMLLYRWEAGGLEVLLGHIGGPFFRKNPRSWSIFKGGCEHADSDLLAAAEREFVEEVGRPAPAGPTQSLGVVVINGNRTEVFARCADFDATNIESNTCEVEWPPKSGRLMTVPEIDRAAWFTVVEAQAKIVASQAVFLNRLAALLPQAVIDTPS
jgi:predicted NUDIX family NTP pyrophosphohydrolase